jgi:hypothetical protein
MAFLCAGDGHVWIFDDTAQSAGTGGPDSNGNPFMIVGASIEGVKKLPGIVTWDMTPDVEESTAIRTSSTAGKKVKPCGDSIEWSIDLTAALDPTDWLYAYILSDPGADTPLDPSLGRQCWAFLTWDVDYRTSMATAKPNVSKDINNEFDMTTYDGSDDGIYVYGTFNPPGVNVDNDASDASVVDFSFNIEAGPFLPRTQSALLDLWTTGPDPDTDITNFVAS